MVVMRCGSQVQGCGALPVAGSLQSAQNFAAISPGAGLSEDGAQISQNPIAAFSTALRREDDKADGNRNATIKRMVNAGRMKREVMPVNAFT